MRISRIAILLFERQLDGKSWNPIFRWTERRAPLIVIEDEHGTTGVGEAWSAYSDIQSVLDALSCDIAPRLLGSMLDHPSEAIRKSDGESPAWPHAAAWSAIDTALWDLHARSLGQPLWQTLGGSSPKAPAYASGGLYRDAYTLEDLAAEARGYLKRGFTAMKMKVAGLTKREDLDRVAAVRAALGSEPVLWVDGVNQWNAVAARQFWTALEPYGVTGLQSPLPPSEVNDLTWLVAEGLPVIASEAEYRPDAFQHILRQRAVRYLQFCLPLCGGFTGALALDNAAQASGCSTTPQCFSTSVAQAATLHFAAARPNVVSAEFHCFHDHLSDLYIPGVAEISNGHAWLGWAPGLGVRIPTIGTQPDDSRIALYGDFH